jgi:hypothetical protein
MRSTCNAIDTLPNLHRIARRAFVDADVRLDLSCGPEPAGFRLTLTLDFGEPNVVGAYEIISDEEMQVLGPCAIVTAFFAVLNAIQDNLLQGEHHAH